MVYDVNGNVLTSVYNLMGDSLSQCYDKDGNPLISDTPEPPSRYRTFSVLADSYGAIQGGVTPDTNVVYYPTEGNDVTSISQMWWYLFGESYGCTLVRNNSFSGSRVANDSSWYAGVENCYIGRASNIGDPDLIFVLGGTNDVWNHIPQGDEYIYDGWTDEDKATFRGALSYLFHYLKTEHPNADIIFICNTVVLRTSDQMWDGGIYYYQSACAICEHYGIPRINVYPEVVGNHPTAAGMGQIRNAIMKYLGEPLNVIRNISISLSLPKALTWNPQHTSFTIDHLEQYSLYRVTVSISAIGGDDTYVKISAAGSSAANFVSFEEYAGQTGTFSKVIEANSFHAGTDVVISINASGTTATATLSAIKIEEVSY